MVSERLLSIMKKALSGNVGIAQSQLEFSTKQVSDSEEHKLLMTLRSTELRDTGALDDFYTKVAESLDLEGNYVVLLANDLYDVFSKGSDGEMGDSTERFSYLVCAVCPVKDAPETLTFREADSLFHAAGASGILSSPELGFMFPAFDDRATNIYGALYYTRSRSKAYPEFTARVFGCESPMPTAIQRVTFNDNLGAALSEDCTIEVVRAVHAAVGEMVEAHKESHDPEPLLITKYTVKTLLESCGVPEEKIEKMTEEMDASFGVGAGLTPKNLVAYNKFEVKMPEVKINLSPEYRDLVSTRMINGEKHLVIKVTGPVEINGITVNLDEIATGESDG